MEEAIRSLKENGEKQAQDIRDIKKSMNDINEIKEMITAMSIKYDQVASRVYESHQEIEETSQEYLQREMYGSAQLENFASGLELIGKKCFPKMLPYKYWILTGCGYTF
ncbi:uncharacterized protein LOC114259772 isoform X2 [Camellia sinensis]|uniref:uncharacterized protein LOC114259772 isoform X2 n=1 Tax=Camellia sinensis TaxID=4442 RepID=UPI00103654B0|nr:uncharacterized protein LOC114259772 isoform X2 [Camellia sinensis]